MSSTLIVGLTVAAVLALALWVARPAPRRSRARLSDAPREHLIVLPVVTTPPRVEEFAPYAGCRERVVLSLAADAPADVVAAAELVAGWYGFGLRICLADQANQANPSDGRGGAQSSAA